MAATMTPHLSNPKEIAEAGEKIYADRYKNQYEREHPAKFVAIDITTEEAYIAHNPEDVLEAARGASPHGVFHLIQVGSSSAFRVSYTLHDDLAWLFQ